VAGDSSRLSPRGWEDRLREAYVENFPDRPVPRLRVIRTERNRALVEIGHRWVPEARAAWNRALPARAGGPIALATRRTWGTLVQGKAWLRRTPPP